MAAIAAGLPARALRVSFSIASSTRACSVKGACQTRRSLEALPSPVSCWNTSFTSAQVSGWLVRRSKSV